MSAPPRLGPAICFSLCFAVLELIGSARAQAGTVKASKATKALINLDASESAGIGDTFVVIVKGVEQGVLEVTATKGRQAMADIVSGEAKAGDRAVKRGAPVPAPPAPTPAPKVEAPVAAAPEPKATPVKAPEPEKPEPADSKKRWKMLGAGVGMDSQRVKLTQAAEVAMKGTSPSVRGSLTGTGFAVFKTLEWEAGFGLEQVKTIGQITTNACKDSRNCAFEITSFTPYGRAGWLPLGHRLGDFALRAGMDFLVPISVNSNVIDYNAFNPLTFLTAGAQIKIKWNERVRIPIAVDYAYYVGNADVSLTRILVYGGYSWR